MMADTSGPPSVRTSADVGADAPAPSHRRREKRQRTRVVGVRLLDAEMLELETRADNSGLSVGAFMRACALETAGPRAQRRIPYDRALFARANADLNRVGNNLNQIAHALNIGRDAPQHVVDAAHAELRDVLTLMRRALGYDRQG